MNTERYKLVVFVPLSHADAVRDAIHAAGGGTLGNYSHASFSSRGVGRFKPKQGANPAVGQIGELNEVEEERIEVLVDKAVVDDVVAAMKKAHPYEEPAYDLYKLENR